MNDFTIDDGTRVALTDQVFEEIDELAFFLIHELSENLKASAFFEFENLIDNLLRRLLDNLFAALGAVRNSDARPEQSQVIVNLGYGSNG